MSVDMIIAITTFWKLFCYGFKRDYHEKLIGIRELSEQLALYCFNNTFSTDTGTLAKNIPLLDKVVEGDTFSNFYAIHFSSYISSYTKFRNISDITINSASSISYNPVTSTIKFQHTYEIEEAK